MSWRGRGGRGFRGGGGGNFPRFGGPGGQFDGGMMRGPGPMMFGGQGPPFRPEFGGQGPSRPRFRGRGGQGPRFNRNFQNRDNSQEVRII